MRRSKHAMIEVQRERARAMARRSNEVQADARLAAALDCAPRSRTLVFELATWNPLRNRGHYLELWHDAGNGRFEVWLDGERWRNGWSRSRFGRWLAGQVDHVLADWD